MRYALISDIHGNLEALSASLEALKKERVDEYLCAGDIIGYGADPGECIRIIRSLKPKVSIAGNHEWGVLGFLDLGHFNDYARDAIIWTKERLSAEEISYLKSLKLYSEEGGMFFVHGSPAEPSEFHYIFDATEAAVAMRLVKTGMCVTGHTHVAGIFCFDEGRVRYSPAALIRCERGMRYLVNAGSIGQPRDGDPRASFIIYDTESAVFEIKRVSYDVKSAQAKILKAGLPAMLAHRLAEGR